MSAVLENTLEEVKDLEGATIERVWISDDGLGEPAVRFRVRFREGLVVNDSRTGEFEVWEDPEGNGPGFLSFVESGPPVR